MTQFSKRHVFTKDEIYELLKEFAKRYKKRYKNSPIELIIVGGSSIVLNYGFREGTVDIDVALKSLGEIKDIINEMADDEGLANDWLNNDFMRTKSYSNKLREVSKHYCSFNNGSVEIRTVKAQYLIAMKMVSARAYREDISDIIGIIKTMRLNGEVIDIQLVNEAIKEMYSQDENIIDENVFSRVCDYLNMTLEELEKLYAEERARNKHINDKLLEYNEEKELNADSAQNVAELLRKRLLEDNEQ